MVKKTRQHRKTDFVIISNWQDFAELWVIWERFLDQLTKGGWQRRGGKKPENSARGWPKPSGF
jgi:hypothetical protein